MGMVLLPNGLPGLSLLDKEANRRIQLGVLDDGSPLLTLMDKSGKNLFKVP